ncbi:MAG: MASE1 domain-containing protein, partial [Pseudomonadota bacterium]|nr:MASE1 domain-containing protein [Pseudomonadota bacterium]
MQARLATLLRAALLSGLYFVGAVVTVFYLRTPADVTLFWPAAGIGFAVVLRHGLAYVLTIPLAMLALHVFVLPVPAEFLPYSVASNTLATLAAGWYVRRRMTSRRILLRTADGLLLLRGGLLLGAISAGIGAFGMVQAGMVPLQDAGGVAVQWALGDVLGVASVSPVLLYAFFAEGPMPTFGGKQPRRVEMGVWAGLLVVILGVVHSVGQLGTQYPLALASLPLSLLLWSAVRYPPLMTLVATSVVIVCVSLMIGLGIGGFERPQTLHDSVLMMSMLVLYSVIPV